MIAELLLKRTTATAVCRVYKEFLGRFPRVDDLDIASEELLVECLSSVGLQRQRTRSLKRLAAWLVDYHEGEVPCDLESLLRIPGLGDYSAAAILSFGYGTPMAVLDANVERIIKRVFGNSLPPRPSKTNLNEVSQRLLPTDNHQVYNYGLLDLGRLVCRYVAPKCDACPLNSICDYWAKIGKNNMGGKLSDPPEETLNSLRIVRRHSGLSLQRLADLAGVSKLTVIRIESGKTTPRLKTIEKLATALQVKIDELNCEQQSV